MKLAIRMQVAALLAALVPFPVNADSPVWKIEKGSSLLYLAGSVHLLTAADYPLPAAFETAYQRSQILVLETDVQAMQSPAGMQRLMQRLSYEGDRNLRQVIGAETYSALRDFFTSRGVPMAQIDRFKPGMVAMMISIVELQRLGMAGVGVDMYLDNRALSDNRPRQFLESIDAQIDFIAGMGSGREDDLLIYTLREAENLGRLMPSLKSAWRTGNMPRLQQLGIEPMLATFPGVYQTMLVNRNRNWMRRIESMLASRETELVVVGALHLAGRDGLLSQLEARGYRIEQLR